MQEYDKEHTFSVQVSETQEYVVDGQRKPIVYLKLGDEYAFDVEAQGYPFAIGTSVLGGVGGKGVEKGRLIFKCTQDVFDKAHYYQCTTVKEMGYKIIVRKG